MQYHYFNCYHSIWQCLSNRIQPTTEGIQFLFCLLFCATSVRAEEFTISNASKLLIKPGFLQVWCLAEIWVACVSSQDGVDFFLQPF